MSPFSSTDDSGTSADVDLPKGVEVHRDGARLRLTRTWSRSYGLVILVWVALWFGMLSFFLVQRYQGVSRLGGRRSARFSGSCLQRATQAS